MYLVTFRAAFNVYLAAVCFKAFDRTVAPWFVAKAALVCARLDSR